MLKAVRTCVAALSILPYCSEKELKVRHLLFVVVSVLSEDGNEVLKDMGFDTALGFAGV